jgi:hypothetical protein
VLPPIVADGQAGSLLLPAFLMSGGERG